MQQHISIQLESTSIDEFLDETTIFDQFERKINPKKPLKETKVDLKRTNSPKKTNFVANW